MAGAAWHHRRFQGDSFCSVDLAKWMRDTRSSEEETGQVSLPPLGSERVHALRRDSCEDSDLAAWLARDTLLLLEQLYQGGIPSLHGFSSVVLEGGILELPGVKRALSAEAQPFELHFAESRRSWYANGASLVLQSLGLEGGVLIDVEHELVHATLLGDEPRDLSFPRNFSRLPTAGPGTSSRVSDPWVERAGDYFGRALCKVLQLGEPTTNLVLAMPCHLDSASKPGVCTYPGWEGNPNVASVVLERIRLLVDELELPSSHPWRKATAVQVALVTRSELIALILESSDAERVRRGLLVLTVGMCGGATLRRAGP